LNNNNNTIETTAHDNNNNNNSDPAIPGSQKGGKKLAIIFTCTVCNTRSAKQFTEKAYQNGVVIVQCPGCQNRHLIADNLGFFEDCEEDGGWNIEKAMEKMGEHVKVITNDNVMEVSVEEVYGQDAIQKATGGAAAAATIEHQGDNQTTK
jgi:mitochondrial protein import protein ZIM17